MLPFNNPKNDKSSIHRTHDRNKHNDINYKLIVEGVILQSLKRNVKLISDFCTPMFKNVSNRTYVTRFLTTDLILYILDNSSIDINLDKTTVVNTILHMIFQVDSGVDSLHKWSKIKTNDISYKHNVFCGYIKDKYDEIYKSENVNS
jgi:hypothetical protein